MQVTIREILLVGAGGFAGSVCRWLISVANMAGGMPPGFPVGTFTVNAAGSLLIGLLMATVDKGSLMLLMVTGFCGGFTTFSTFSAESFGLLREGHLNTAALYVAASVMVCVFMVWVGMALGTKLK